MQMPACSNCQHACTGCCTVRSSLHQQQPPDYGLCHTDCFPAAAAAAPLLGSYSARTETWSPSKQNRLEFLKRRQQEKRAATAPRDGSGGVPSPDVFTRTSLDSPERLGAFPSYEKVAGASLATLGASLQTSAASVKDSGGTRHCWGCRQATLNE